MDEFQRDGFASRDARAGRGRGSGFAPEDHRRNVHGQFVHEAEAEQFEVECAAALDHQAFHAQFFQRTQRVFQIHARVVVNIDFDAAGSQNFNFGSRCLIGGKYYDARRADIEKIGIRLQVCAGDDAHFDGICRPSARHAFGAQRLALDRQFGILVEQGPPADHDRVRLGAQTIHARLVQRGRDGRAASFEGVHFAIRSDGDVNKGEWSHSYVDTYTSRQVHRSRRNVFTCIRVYLFTTRSSPISSKWIPPSPYLRRTRSNLIRRAGRGNTTTGGNVRRC